MKALLNSLLVLILTACATQSPPVARQANTCEKTRAAFDIGSGSTRVLVAQVNVCENRLLKVLYEGSDAVAYRDQLGSNGLLSDAVLTKGRDVLRSLKEKAAEAGATEYRAIATEVFRSSQNGEAFIQKTSAELGFPIKVITQEMEARLGYLGALSQIPNPESTFIVWDMGAGSTQVTYHRNNLYFYYFPQTGSVVFKEAVVKNVLKKNPDEVKSPNPFTKQSLKAAQKLALETLRREKTPTWLSKLKQEGRVKSLYGIGGVLVKSVQGQIDKTKNVFTPADVSRALQLQFTKDDEALGGKYASTQITNLILIEAFMKHYKVRQVHTIDVNLTQGLAIDPSF